MRWARHQARVGLKNGSILFDYDADFTIPLDPDKQDSADFFKIADSNTYVESSVKSDTGAIGGGASYSSDNPWSGEAAQETNALAMAAKQDATEERDNKTGEASSSIAKR